MKTSTPIGRAIALVMLHVAAAGAQAPPQPQPLGPPPVPPANPLTSAKVQLGQILFWDEQLSVTGTVACGTCHRAFGGGSDPRTALDVSGNANPGPDNVPGDADDVHASAGVPAHGADGLYVAIATFGIAPQTGTRRSLSAIDAAYSPLLFWDGRASGRFADPQTGQVIIAQGGALESQSLQPLLNVAEMSPSGATSADIGMRIADREPLGLATNAPVTLTDWIAGRSYAQLFTEAFGSADISAAHIAMALASYERTLTANQTPIDSQFAGTPSLTPLEQQGQQVFVANDCAACHAGSLFSDNQFHYTGVRPVSDDLGRFAITANNADRGAFRTPSLRNVALRAPYMHNGRLMTLADVVDFYDRGGDFNAPNKDPRVRPRNLDAQQKAALVAFLQRPLTDLRTQAESGPFERPTLYTESDRVPAIVGNGIAGAGGEQPQIEALEPPQVGNRNFTVAVSHALGGGSATLVVDHADPGIATTIPNGAFANRVVVLAGSGTGQGTASVNLDLDNDTGLIGQTLYGRFYIVDAGAPGGLAITQAFRITVFGNSGRVFANGFE
ncbi:MAG: cytochrome c peroxidase [Dokdonella sp.]